MRLAWGHLRGYVGPSSSYVVPSWPSWGYVGHLGAMLALLGAMWARKLSHVGQDRKNEKPQNTVNCGRIVPMEVSWRQGGSPSPTETRECRTAVPQPRGPWATRAQLRPKMGLT